MPLFHVEQDINFKDPESTLDLENIRQALVRMEDTIVFDLIERASFPTQPHIYTPGKVPIPDFNGSFLDWLLSSEENVHAKIRRFQSPYEYPFFPENLPDPILPPIDYPKVLFPSSKAFSVNNEIKDIYINNIIPSICRTGTEAENEGSTLVADAACLRSLSRRIHFGKFVAESKFRSSKEKYIKFISEKDISSIEKEITNEAVEIAVLERLRKKAQTFGVDPFLRNDSSKAKVDVEAVVDIYKNFVIPLTKKVEIEYLLQRLS